MRKTIKVDALARVEGEGALDLVIRDGAVERAHLRIFEPPRFFEAFLRGRDFTETPDIVARICGICPVAYQMSAVHALERGAGVAVAGTLRELRRLLYCGEWIESHVLHIYMLHAPDFLGYESAVHMAKDHREVVERGLQLKKVGNEILRVLGGREIHPVNVRVGGFYRVPSRTELATLIEPLERARDAALATIQWVSAFEFPAQERDYEFVALRHGAEYPMNEGRIVSSKGLDIAVDDYESHFVERQVPHSTALHSVRIDGGNYFVGPMARLNLNFDCLPATIQTIARDVGMTSSTCRNPYRSIVARSIEVLYACEEALRIVRGFVAPEKSWVEVPATASNGCAATEAPRGLLYHRYRVAADGKILEAKIVPPTSQNQATIEDDLRVFAGSLVELPDEQLKWRCEQMIRNYDPCISCATHFLKLRVERL